MLPLRRLCALAITAIGLIASIATAPPKRVIIDDEQEQTVTLTSDDVTLVANVLIVSTEPKLHDVEVTATWTNQADAGEQTHRMELAVRDEHDVVVGGRPPPITDTEITTSAESELDPDCNGTDSNRGVCRTDEVLTIRLHRADGGADEMLVNVAVHAEALYPADAKRGVHDRAEVTLSLQ